jgi:modulator of FtsH protease
MDAFNQTLDAWQPFFAAQLGAAATLAGLVFVGLSLNLTRILTFPALPTRALMALILLLVVVVVSSLMLIPGQTTNAIAVEILAVGAIGWVSVTAMDLHVLRCGKLQNRAGYIGNLVMLQLAALPYIAGGTLLLGGSSSGLYVVSIGVLVSFVKALLDAWVLLVEINR